MAYNLRSRAPAGQDPSAAKTATVAKKTATPKKPATKAVTPKKATPKKAAPKKPASKKAAVETIEEAPVITVTATSSVAPMEDNLPICDTKTEDEPTLPAMKETPLPAMNEPALPAGNDPALPVVNNWKNNASFGVFTDACEVALKREVNASMEVMMDTAAKSEAEAEEEEEAAVETEPEIPPAPPATSISSAFAAFTSTEPPKSFNWNNQGSTYYKSDSEHEDKETREDDSSTRDDFDSIFPSGRDNKVVEEKPAAVSFAPPTVLSNPFSFGFSALKTATSTVANNSEVDSVAVGGANDKATDNNAVSLPYNHRPQSNYPSGNAHLPIDNPAPRPFFHSVSSPLDKLCTLTQKSAADNCLSAHPTRSPMMLSKSLRSPALSTDGKDVVSPTAIQSIIVDDRGEDFSAI